MSIMIALHHYEQSLSEEDKTTVIQELKAYLAKGLLNFDVYTRTILYIEELEQKHARVSKL